MCGPRTLNRHAALVSRMADTLGVDLTAALRDHRLSTDEWRDAVMACTGCRDADGCMVWLAEHTDLGADAPPAQCRNDALLARLAPAAAAG